MATKQRSPYFYSARDGGKQHKPEIHTNSKWMSMSMQTHKSSTRSGKGQRKPPSITKAYEPTRSRQLQEPTNPRKKCLANPQRESALTKQEMIGTQNSIDQLRAAATTDRTPNKPQRKPIRTQGTKEQRHRAANLRGKSTTHDHSHGRRPLVTRAMQSLPFLVGTYEQGPGNPRPRRFNFDQEPHLMQIAKSSATHNA